MSHSEEEAQALPLMPADVPRLIEARENNPELVLDYIPGAVDPSRLAGPSYTVFSAGEKKQCRSYIKCLNDVQFTYPQPADPDAKHGTSAYAWFADRGDWSYAPERQQRNALVPCSMPEWLRQLGQQLHVASEMTRLVGTGWNCCLISYGTSSVWSCGEDPWHLMSGFVTEFFVGESVRITVRHENGSYFMLDPLPGSLISWRGPGSTLEARSDQPFFRLSFRVLVPLKEHAQWDAKMPHRMPEALAMEQRIVPLHLTLDQRERLMQGQRPHPLVIMNAPPAKAKHPVGTPVEYKRAPAAAKREKPASILAEEAAEKASEQKKAKTKKKAPPPVPRPPK